MKKILILGGTSGFGIEFARVLSSQYIVTVTGRKNITEPNIESIIFDSSMVDSKFLHSLNPDVVVNNGYDKNNHLNSFENSLIAVRESLKYFKAKKGGVLVNVNSIAGLQPDANDPDYAASKHGLKGFVDSISLDAYRNNINIINLYPRAISAGISNGRADFSKLINPTDLAKFCMSLLEINSFYVSTIVFDRVFSYDGNPISQNKS